MKELETPGCSHFSAAIEGTLQVDRLEALGSLQTITCHSGRPHPVGKRSCQHLFGRGRFGNSRAPLLWDACLLPSLRLFLPVSMPSGVASPANSANGHPFFRSVTLNKPRR
jgi:hypothetical protein